MSSRCKNKWITITPTLIGAGAHGKVFEACSPDEKTPCSKVAKIQPLYHPLVEAAWRNEVKFAKQAAELGIGPEVYSSFVCDDIAKTPLFSEVPLETFFISTPDGGEREISFSDPMTWGIMIAKKLDKPTGYEQSICNNQKHVKSAIDKSLAVLQESKLWNFDLTPDNFILTDVSTETPRAFIVDWGEGKEQESSQEDRDAVLARFFKDCT